MSDSSEIEACRREMLKKRFQNEINWLSSQTTDDTMDVARLASLRLICESIPELDTKKKSMNQHYSDMESMMYKRQWRYLSPFHKIVKLKEYAKKTYTDPKLRDRLTMLLSQYVHNKKLMTNKCVTYSPEKEEIESIPALQYNEENDKYFVK